MAERNILERFTLTNVLSGQVADNVLNIYGWQMFNRRVFTKLTVTNDKNKYYLCDRFQKAS